MPRLTLAPLALLALTACSTTPAAGDASPDVAPDLAVDAPRDVAVDLTLDASLARCSLNRDCPASERCRCAEATGCRCEAGARGTGVAGVDRCATGDDCATGLCVEGTGAFVCSDGCTAASDCPAALPRCVSVPTVGRFCARDPAARPDASVDAPAGCQGACATTSLAGVFGAMRGNFDRAQHGNATASTLRIEAHFGGDPACPTMTSPTPQRTLVLTGVRATADATPQTEATGVRATLFDFGGALVSAPLVRATAVRVTPRGFAQGQWVSLEVSATFPGGTITGGLFAPWCAGLDGG